MLKTLRHFTSEGIEIVEFSGNFKELSSNGTYWLEIKSSDRMAIADYMSSLITDQKALMYVNQPDKYSRILLISNSLVMNLPVTNTNEILETDYLTVFATNNIIITILPEQNSILEELAEVIQSNHFIFQLSLYLVLYFIISEILQNGIDNSFLLRKKVNTLAIKLEAAPDSLPLKEIIQCKREVGQVYSIIQDQYHVLGFMPKLNLIDFDETKNVREELNELFRGYDYLEKNMERQEDKLESLHVQYQLMLHEQGNKRLNTLTIVQAIFVPLTLIAGIYGMNFSRMPELNWPSGYFLILGFMGLIVLIELWWFRKKGWFD